MSPCAAAIVLTGGQSSRMGTDKASLIVDGQAMADRVVAVLRSADIENVVIAGHHGVPDPASESLGPMAGIVSGWRHLRDQARTDLPDPVIVLSCDLTAIVPEVVTSLVTASASTRSGAVAHDGERMQPLIAAYRPSALDEMTAAFDSGERSVRRCFGRWDLAVVHFDRSQLLDADTPADLADYQVEWP